MASQAGKGSENISNFSSCSRNYCKKPLNLAEEVASHGQGVFFLAVLQQCHLSCTEVDGISSQVSVSAENIQNYNNTYNYSFHL